MKPKSSVEVKKRNPVNIYSYGEGTWTWPGTFALLIVFRRTSAIFAPMSWFGTVTLPVP